MAVADNGTFISRWADFLDRHGALVLLSILFLALLVRIIALLDLKGSLYFDFMLWDERLYHEWAKKIADGSFYSTSVYEFAPLPAYFMALVYKIFSPDIVYIRYANIIFGVLTVYLVYRIGRELAGDTVGLASALAAALYKPFILYSIVPLKTALSVFLFAAAVYFFLVVYERPSLPSALFMGIFMGMIDYVRPNAIVLALLFPLLVLWNHGRVPTPWKTIAALLLVYSGGLALVHSPFMIRNYRVAGESGPTTSQTGIHLYMTTFPDKQKLNFVTTSPAERGIQFTIEASRRSGRRLTNQEASAYWAREFFKKVRRDPEAYLSELFKKVLRFFNRIERADHYHIGFLSRFVKFFKLPFLSLGLILPFGMAGMVIGSIRSRKSLGLAVVFFSYASTLFLFFTNIRMRLPVLAILIPFSVAGIGYLWAFFKAKDFKRVGIYLGLVTAFFIVEFLPGVTRDEMTAHYNTYAIMLNSRGRKAEAIQYWETSSQMNGRYSDFADLSLGSVYMQKGDYEKSFAYLQRVGDDSFAAAPKYDLMGDLMMKKRALAKAIAAYERAVSINAGLLRPRRKLVKIFAKIDPQRARIEYETLKYIASFYDLYGSKRKAASH